MMGHREVAIPSSASAPVEAVAPRQSTGGNGAKFPVSGVGRIGVEPKDSAVITS